MEGGTGLQRILWDRVGSTYETLQCFPRWTLRTLADSVSVADLEWLQGRGRGRDVDPTVDPHFFLNPGKKLTRLCRTMMGRFPCPRVLAAGCPLPRLSSLGPGSRSPLLGLVARPYPTPLAPWPPGPLVP